jgi:hypothetical protein
MKRARNARNARNASALLAAPSDVLARIAEFMDPLDLYMCKQTCTALAHIDRGHPCRDTSLSMVGTQYAMHQLCCVCEGPCGRAKAYVQGGMYAHERCIHQKLALHTYLDKDGVLERCTHVGAPGRYLALFDRWVPALWHFQDYARVGARIDFKPLLSYFEQVRTSEYIRTHVHGRVIRVGRLKVDVWYAFRMHCPGKVQGSGYAQVRACLQYEIGLHACVRACERVYKEKRRVPRATLAGFYSFITKSTLCDLAMLGAENMERTICSYLHQYDIYTLTRHIMRIVHACAETLACTCLACGDLFTNFQLTQFRNHLWMVKVVDEVYTQEDIKRFLRALRDFMLRFLVRAKTLTHEGRVSACVRACAAENGCALDVYLTRVCEGAPGLGFVEVRDFDPYFLQ